MKKIVSVFLIVMLTFISSSNLHAEEDGEQDDNNNLNLDTEILNNKKEDYNSNTSIGDINLFTKDYKEQLLEESKKKTLIDERINNSLFSDNTISIKKNDNESKNLFNQAVEISKIEFDETATSDYTVILIIAFSVLSIFAFVLTRRKYKKRKE